MKESEGPSAGPLLVAAATILGNLYLVLGTLILAAVALIVGWLPPRGRLVFLVARLWSRGVLRSSLTRVEASFSTHLGPEARYVYMANHRSLFDIPALLVTLPGQTIFMAKKSLFRIPIFGWAMRLGGFVTIDRQDRSSAGESFAQAVSALREGASVLVFPEGARATRPGLLPFNRGGFLLALKSGLPIVPVGIRGSDAVQTRASFKIVPGVIRVHYGVPLPVDGRRVSGREELMEQVRDQIGRLAGMEVDEPALAKPAEQGESDVE
jgi:1-acyl-sn-glycerol-3-phosphate acyltransferase